MDLLEQWPINVQQFLIKSYGKPTFINKLNGIKAEGGCYRVEFHSFSAIVKQMTRPQEYLFYNKCSQKLHKYIPFLYWSYKDDRNFWIVIEDIPYALPKERWKADEKVLEVLFHFHAEMWNKSLPIENCYIPKWDNRMTEAVLELFTELIGNQIGSILFELQEESKQLFKPYCWINADTNPTNWGVRKDGTVVLFDWERISYGSPAIDLSITMPGLGTLDNSLERLITQRYLQMWSNISLDFPFSEQELLRQIKLAKVWSVVEFLDNNGDMLDYDALQLLLTELAENIKSI